MARRLTWMLSALVLVVSACSSSGDQPTGPTQPTPPMQQATLTIGGEQQRLDGDVACSSHSAGFVIRVGDGPGRVLVVLEPGGENAVDSVELSDSTGTALVSRNASVTSDGDVYVITGDAGPTAADVKPFELRVDCYPMS